MIETLKTRKEELEKRGKKGFTLMEMLIVIAIIAVLIAIAIPIFTAQLEKSREATDLANVRSAYAEQMAAFLTDNTPPAAIRVPATQTQANWQSEANEPASAMIAEGHAGSGVSVPAVTASGVYVVSIDSAGVVTVTAGS